MGNGVNGVHSPSAPKLVVEELGRGQDDAITHHPEMVGRHALGSLFNNKNATLKPAVSSSFFSYL